MSRRKRANPVRVATYNEENGDNEAIVPSNSYQFYNETLIDNCKRGQGNPIMIEKPVFEEMVRSLFCVFQGKNVNSFKSISIRYIFVFKNRLRLNL